LIGQHFAVRISFTIIETRLSSSGQKNMLVITGATISSLTERFSPCPKPNLRNAMPKQDYSRLLWMGGSSGPSNHHNEILPTLPVTETCAEKKTRGNSRLHTLNLY